MLKYNNLKYLTDIFTGLSIKVYSIGDIVSFVPSGFVGGGGLIYRSMMYVFANVVDSCYVWLLF